MRVDEQTLYILIEGTENSPEVTFIKDVIRQLVNAEKLPDILSDVVAVGSSSVFNSFAQIIYNKSRLHKQIPVLALRDRDWFDETIIQRDRAKNNKSLIENKNVRYLYWDRHEWENFLLDEVEIIATIFNEIPVRQQGVKQKSFKSENILITASQLNTWLLDYFKKSVTEELIEFLRFKFNKSRRYPDINHPSDDENINVEYLKQWFLQPIISYCQVENHQNHIDDINLCFENAIKENWETWLNNPETVNFKQAKVYFRGKEAFKSLFEYCSKLVKLHPEINDRQFIQEVLFPKLQKNINSSLIENLCTLLLPYFREARS